MKEPSSYFGRNSISMKLQWISWNPSAGLPHCCELFQGGGHAVGASRVPCGTGEACSGGKTYDTSQRSSHLPRSNWWRSPKSCQCKATNCDLWIIVSSSWCDCNPAVRSPMGMLMLRIRIFDWKKRPCLGGIPTQTTGTRDTLALLIFATKWLSHRSID